MATKQTLFWGMVQIVILVLLSMTFTTAGAPKTTITLEFLEGGDTGDFREVGFYSVMNGKLTRTPIASAPELRNIEGKQTYVLDGHYTTERMYVIGSQWGHIKYLYTESQYNPLQKDHFTTNNKYFWFEHNTDPYTGQCEYFNDYGYKVVSITTYLEQTSECRDMTDNDGDGLVDKNDPGCWDNPLYRSSYNPERNDESRHTIMCSADTDCNAGYTCAYPGTGLAHCVPKQDTHKPTVVLHTPHNNGVKTGAVEFRYTPTDDTYIIACELIINGKQTLTNAKITTNAENIFTTAFPQSNVYITAQVNCYDSNDNKGTSNTITFFYGDHAPECSVNNECGSVTTTYICDGDDVVKETTTPICTITGQCDEDIDTEYVKTCSDSCKKGECVKKKTGKDNSYDDDTNSIPIIQDTNPATDDIEVIYIEDTTTNTQETTESSPYLWVIVILLLLIAIMVILVLMVMVTRTDTKNDTHKTEEEPVKEPLY